MNTLDPTKIGGGCYFATPEGSLLPIEQPGMTETERAAGQTMKAEVEKMLADGVIQAPPSPPVMPITEVKPVDEAAIERAKKQAAEMARRSFGGQPAPAEELKPPKSAR